MIPKEICKDYIIEYKNLIINLRCRLVMVSGHLVTLCPKEFAMLCLLANYPGWVFTKEQIYCRATFYGSQKNTIATNYFL